MKEQTQRKIEEVKRLRAEGVPLEDACAKAKLSKGTWYANSKTDVKVYDRKPYTKRAKRTETPGEFVVITTVGNLANVLRSLS